jgi:hypothetical protein
MNTNMEKLNLRKEWFVFVSKVRKQKARKTKEPVSHRDAMKSAALEWPVEKQKIIRRHERNAKKQKKQNVKEEKEDTHG